MVTVSVNGVSVADRSLGARVVVVCVVAPSHISSTALSQQTSCQRTRTTLRPYITVCLCAVFTGAHVL